MTGLDQAFTGRGGNAPALVGWLEYLANPEENQGPRVLELVDGSAIESSGKPHPNVGGQVLERSVLRDLTLDRFFAHASVLSGQRIGTVTEDGEIANSQQLGDTFDLIEEAFLKKHPESTRPDHSVDVWRDINVKINAVVSRENWDSGAADNARDRYSTMVQWYENHRNLGLTAMNEFLVKFAAIILKARADINELMGKTVTILNNAAADTTQGEIEFAVSALDKILNVVLNLPKTAADATLLVSDAIKNAMTPATKSSQDSGFGIDPSDLRLGYYRMFESFIEAGDKVCWEAAGAVATLVTDAENGLLFVRRHWVSAPRWPG
ncbi:hypothetical protein [Actinophytocola sediminis]